MLTRQDYWLLLYMVSSVCFSEPLVKLSATGLFFAAGRVWSASGDSDSAHIHQVCSSPVTTHRENIT